jgi:hypothetical protein
MSLWYLDSSASGTNVGTSWTNAWNSPTSVVWGASGVKAGDTLYVSGGSTSKNYTTTLTIGASGTAGNLITISTGIDAGHTGTVTFENAQINVGSYKYIHITGGALKHFLIQNVAPGSDYTAAIVGSEGGHLIEYIKINNCPSGIAFTTAITDPCTADHCDLTLIYGKVGIDFRGEGDLSVYDKYVISNCNIQGVYATSPLLVGPDLIHVRAGSTVKYNHFSYVLGTPNTDEHPDIIQQMGPKYVKIYGNTFDGSVDSCIDVDFFFSTDRTMVNFWIFNNLICSTNPSKRNYQAIRIYTNSGGFSLVDGLRIFNNTLVDIENRTLGIFGGVSTNVTNTFIKNNVFVNSAGIDIELNPGYSAASWNVDYNIISAGAHGSITCYVSGAYTQTHGSNSTPTFVSYTENADSNNLQLTSGDTVALNQGTDLSAYTTVDILGTNRPQGAAFDIGAFEFPLGDVSPNNNITTK